MSKKNDSDPLSLPGNRGQIDFPGLLWFIDQISNSMYERGWRKHRRKGRNKLVGFLLVSAVLSFAALSLDVNGTKVPFFSKAFHMVNLCGIEHKDQKELNLKLVDAPADSMVEKGTFVSAQSNAEDCQNHWLSNKQPVKDGFQYYTLGIVRNAADSKRVSWVLRESGYEDNIFLADGRGTFFSKLNVGFEQIDNAYHVYKTYRTAVRKKFNSLGKRITLFCAHDVNGTIKFFPVRARRSIGKKQTGEIRFASNH